jgi:hypothetical protein
MIVNFTPVHRAMTLVVVSTFEDLAAANPNIRQQADEWRDARATAGEDAAWWPDFRQHVVDLGAPDPGEEPPDDWVGPDYTQPTH